MAFIPVPMVPEVRIRQLNSHPVDASGDYVLYWMTAFRRTTSNFSLQRAVEWSENLKKPLVILEALRCNYRWASDRFHRFIVDGMVDNANATLGSNALYCAYVERERGAGSGLVETMAKNACVVVSDDFPCFFHPAMYHRIARRWGHAVELVDSNTIVPMRATNRTFTVAHSYRRYMQKVVYDGLPEFPVPEPLDFLRVSPVAKLPAEVTRRWELFSGQDACSQLAAVDCAELPIDHNVKATRERGGPVEGTAVLERFMASKLSAYAEARNEPEQQGSSWLSPYLHFGHVSPHAVFQRLAEATNWDARKLGKPNGKMTGFWNMGADAEAFLDQLMTWREIGFNQCWRDPHYDRFESLPDWAQKTLQDHEGDHRSYTYSLEEFEQSQTHDALWNAAQQQLVRDGRMHNYLRMLWGKKILHWSRSPREALQVMIELNNKYALDGRDPNSYSGIFWVLGRYDRAWGPEREIFGKVRYMTSESTQSKFRVKNYIAKYT